MDLNRAKSRLYLRLEKFFITLESLFVAAFVGVCVGFYFGYLYPAEFNWKIGATFGIVFFVGIFVWKRFIINKELKK